LSTSGDYLDFLDEEGARLAARAFPEKLFLPPSILLHLESFCLRYHDYDDDDDL
jgi:hypothetical protein